MGLTPTRDFDDAVARKFPDPDHLRRIWKQFSKTIEFRQGVYERELTKSRDAQKEENSCPNEPTLNGKV